MKRLYILLIVVFCLVMATAWGQEKTNDDSRDTKQVRDPFSKLRLTGDQGSPDGRTIDENSTLGDVIDLKGVIIAGEKKLAIFEVNKENIMFFRLDQVLRLSYEGGSNIVPYTLIEVGEDYVVFTDSNDVHHVIRIK